MQECNGYGAVTNPEEAVSFTVLTGSGFEKVLQPLGAKGICGTLQRSKDCCGTGHLRTYRT